MLPDPVLEEELTPKPPEEMLAELKAELAKEYPNNGTLTDVQEALERGLKWAALINTLGTPRTLQPKRKWWKL